MRIAFSTFGCKINQFESDELKRSFQSSGNVIVSFEEQADIYVINTCTVTGKSDYQCRQAIRSALRRGSGAKVIVTGCYAETNPAELRKIEGITKIVGNDNKLKLHEYLGFPSVLSSFEATRDSVPLQRTRSVIKIQDGCESNCTYCIIPKARGKSRSVPAKTVLAQFQALVQTGAPEIVLSGIHIGKYGRDIAPDLSLTSLLRDLITVRGTSRIRLSSIEPREITAEIIDLLGTGLCRHLHIPLQSGDDQILRTMNRDYSSGFYRKQLENIKKIVPDAALGADIIVGFPGEGEDEYLNTLRMLNESLITHVHIFSYSRRAGTIASQLPNQVSERDKKARSEELRRLGLKKNLEFRRMFVGKTLPVVIEQHSENNDGHFKGMSDNYIRIAVRGVKKSHIGKQINVLIEEASDSKTLGCAL